MSRFVLLIFSAEVFAIFTVVRSKTFDKYETKEVNVNSWTTSTSISGKRYKLCKHYLGQCFPTFLGSRHKCQVRKLFGSTTRWLNRYKEQELVIIGGTPGTNSQHPGWESLGFRNNLGKRSDILILFGRF